MALEAMQQLCEEPDSSSSASTHAAYQWSKNLHCRHSLNALPLSMMQILLVSKPHGSYTVAAVQSQPQPAVCQRW